MPPENTTLFFPMLEWKRNDAEEQRHSINRVSPALTEPTIRLNNNVTEDELVVVEYEQPLKVNDTTASYDDKLYPGESSHEGSRERADSGSVGRLSLPHLRKNKAGVGAANRGSNVYWRNEAGVVHIRRLPRHKPKKPLHAEDNDEMSTHEDSINTQGEEGLLPHNYEKTTTQPSNYPEETGESSTQTSETTTLQRKMNTDELEDASAYDFKDPLGNTEEMEEISTIASDLWVTDKPETEDWLTEAPEGVTDALEERLTHNDDNWKMDGIQAWQALTYYAETSTETPSDRATNIYVDGEWPGFAPEEQLTDLAEDWLSTTPNPSDDWLTVMPHDEHTTDTQEENLQFISTLPPTTSSIFPPLHPPTIPPSLPPTPSPQDALEDSLGITTRGLDFLLEASPTGQASMDATDLPKNDLFTLDLTITTTREGLNADVRDVTFDPSQIAKATSYEGSSYPTATRSATVTTTWAEDDRLLTLDHQNLTTNDDLANSGAVGDLNKLSTKLQDQDIRSEEWKTSTVPASDGLATLQQDETSSVANKGSDSHSRSNSPIQTHLSSSEDIIYTTASTTLIDSTESQAADTTEHQGVPYNYEVQHHPANTSNSRLGGLPMLTLNMTDRKSDNGAVNGSNTKTEEAVMYEIPVVTRNPSQTLNPSMVVALSVCCAVVMMLAALSVTLWVCRRHRNRSKIYLSREAAKPRAFITRPMNPAVLPEESDHEDAVYMLEFQRPRPPIMLGDDQKGIYFIKQDTSKGSEVCGATLGVENAAFTDVPLVEAGDQGRPRLDPPKYDFKTKQDSDTDSGIRVWSSTGSLHAAGSPLPTHCRVPPPPYSPSISKESVCLSVHSLPSLPRNSQLFDV